jgi:GT2 family glycosyltransferase
MKTHADALQRSRTSCRFLLQERPGGGFTLGLELGIPAARPLKLGLLRFHLALPWHTSGCIIAPNQGVRETGCGLPTSNGDFTYVALRNILKILAVLVLYNADICDCPAIDIFTGNDSLSTRSTFSLLVYDNSATAQVAGVDERCGYRYVHDPSNGGVAAAYSYALRLAVDEGADWILLLDQDTDLPVIFLPQLAEAGRTLLNEELVAAVVPKIRSRGRLVSPTKPSALRRQKPLDPECSGLVKGPVTAINSGTMVRVSFIELLGGIERAFWLDFLDHWLFNRICNAGKCVYVLDAILDHHLSIENYTRDVSEARYRNILASETIFIRTYAGRWDGIFYPALLLARALKHLIWRRNPRFFLITLEHMALQLLASSNRALPRRKSPPAENK